MKFTYVTPQSRISLEYSVFPFVTKSSDTLYLISNSKSGTAPFAAATINGVL